MQRKIPKKLLILALLFVVGVAGAILLRKGPAKLTNPADLTRSTETTQTAEVASMPEIPDTEPFNQSPRQKINPAYTDNMGKYEPYSEEKFRESVETGKTVLFFRRPSCETCRALDANIKKLISSIPKGITILAVDMESNADLAQNYNVTEGNTLIQVDRTGRVVASWIGDATLASVLQAIR